MSSVKFEAFCRMSAGRLGKVAISALLVGVAACTPLPVRPPAAQSAPLPTLKVSPVAEAQDLPLQLLDGQFKLQGGDIKGGAQAYARAAQLSSDPGLAEQATQLALVAGDWETATTVAERWHALAPAAPGVQQARGWIALGKGQNEAALAAFAQLIDRSGDQVWRLAGQALLGAPDKAKAAALLSQLATPQRLGSQAVTWLAMSQLAFKLGDKRFSQDLSDQAVDRFHDAESYAWNAHLAVDRGDRSMAQVIFAEGLRRHPDSPRLRTGYAAILAESGDEAAAAKALSGGVQDDVTYTARMTYAVRADDKPRLAALYREVRNDKATQTPTRLYLLGQLAELNADLDPALGYYRSLPLGDERWFEAQLRQAVVLDQAGRIEQALEAARRLQAESGLDNDQIAKAFLLEADLLKRHRRDAEARAVYDRALNFLPNESRLLYSRALLAAAAGDVATAEDDLRQVIAQDPDDAAALNALGYTLADQTDRLDEALPLIEQAYRLQPDEPSIIDSLGWVQYRLGRHAEAVATLRKAYDKLDDPEIAAHYAQALWAHGDRDGARKVLADARRKEPDSAILRETQQRLMP